ncbi:MAG: 1-acyl-sn-glycerol-3-phosphate acyltransferase [Bacteroidota bacterium]|jgi:1-acyl-sn-glycerol-3-phosphate acyltransferase
MGINRIDKKSYLYLFLKQFVAFWHNKVFYRRVVIRNRELVPKNAHLIFTGNHQNALMDAMVFLFGVKGRLVFMARSDVFNKPIIASILYFFRMLPVFRIRDGYSSVKKNDKIFQKTIDVIKNKIGIVIMAEGNHGDERRLRPLKKGFARIAFITEEANDFKLDMKIVPVGMDFSVYENFRSELLINFGKPIPVSDYYQVYKENPSIAINQIKGTLAESLKSLMVQIKSEKHYQLYNEVREIYKHEMAKKMGFPSAKQPYKLQADQELIRKMELFEENNPNQMDDFQELVVNYKKNILEQKIDYEIAGQKTTSYFRLICEFVLYLGSFPGFLVGWLFNYLPFGFSIYMANKVKDKQFHSSFKFAITLFLWPLWFIIVTTIFWFINRDVYLTLGFFVLIPVSGILARFYWTSFQHFLKKWRWTRLKDNQVTIYEKIRTVREQIFAKVDSITTSLSQ